MGTSFETVWKRVTRHAGEQFRTQTGQVFRYEIVEDDKIRVAGTDRLVSRGELEQYHRQTRDLASGEIALLSGGPSFVWAILIDPRIKDSSDD
jgi:hypothetical protein